MLNRREFLGLVGAVTSAAPALPRGALIVWGNALARLKVPATA